MKRVGLLGIVLAFVTTAFAAATPAFAATQNLSGTVTTSINQSVGGTFTDAASNPANITGAPGGATPAYLVLTHTSGNLLATWTINAVLSQGFTDIGATFTFYKDPASTMGVSNMAQIVLTDSSNNTATLSTNLSMSTGSGPYTISTVFSAYTLSGSFNAANVNAVSFTFAVGASGNKTFGLDAVDVIDSPEPSAIALFGLGLAGIGGGLLRRRRARRAAAARSAA